MTVNRQVLESPLEQGVEEEIGYILTTTPWGSSPSSVSVTVWAITTPDNGPTYTNVTSTVMPSGSPSVAGDEITLPKLKLLTDGVKYRAEVKFTTGGNVFEAYFFVQCKR
jgi:hypothetical protein